MSDSEDPLSSLDSLVDQYELEDHLHSIGDSHSNVQRKVAAVASPSPPPPPTEPMVRWKKRDQDGNVISQRPGSSRKLKKAGPRHITDALPGPSRITDPVPGPSCIPDPPLSVSDTTSSVAFSVDANKCFLQDLQQSLDDFDEQEASQAPLQAPSNWSTRQSVLNRAREQRGTVF